MTLNQTPLNIIRTGDARAVLPELATIGLSGAVKLVYLDPPFNTRRFDRTGGHYKDHRTRQSWDALVRDVLMGARELMRNDGSLWLQIDERELGAAHRVCDEVFGAENSAGIVTWVNTRRPSFLHGQLASVTDHLLVYGKDRKRLGPFTLGSTAPGKRLSLAHRGNPVRELRFPIGAVRFNCSDGRYPAGNHSSPGIDVRLLSEVTVDLGRNATPLHMSLPSRFSPARVDQLLDGNADFLVPKLPFRPSYISPGGAPKLISNLWSWQSDDAMETNEDSAKQQELLFPGRPFPYAKPEGLLRRIVEVASDPGDIVLDAFAGSGTTAAAAQKLGRSWVMIEESESIVENYLRPRLVATQGTRPA